MGRTNALGLLLVLLIGTAIGLAIGAMFDFGSMPPSAPQSPGTGLRSSGSPTAAPAPGEAARSGSEETPASPSTRRVGVEDEAAPFSPALLAYFTDEIRKAWRVSRHEEIPPEDAATALEECRRQTLELPGAVGNHAAEERTKDEKAAAAKKDGDAGGILDALKSGRPIVSWDEAADVLDRMVARRGSGKVVDGVAFASNEDAAEDKITIEFPAGCWTLDSRRLSGNQGVVPSDIQIAGAGMNATLLTMSDIRSLVEIRRFSMRDLTIFTKNGGIFDVRGGSLSFDFERVRMIGFDTGKGGSCLLDVSQGGTAARFRSCEILGGFGRSPGCGVLMRNAPAVMLFQACLLERLELELRGIRSGSRMLFEACTFSQMPDPRSEQTPSLHFSSCNIQLERPKRQLREPAVPRPLTELFPNCR